MESEKKDEIYIGDGVYLEWTGVDFILKTNRGLGMVDQHYIHLEYEQMLKLPDHCKKLIGVEDD